jgi:predicted nucleic acid-binding protein
MAGLPSDSRVFAAALPRNGRAALIVTGDRDLLELHPFLEIPILSPADYLRRG